MSGSQTLRDHILQQLAAKLPHHPRLQLYCLTSTPRKCKELFAYAEKPGRCWETDHLIALSVEMEVEAGPSKSSSIPEVSGSSPTPAATPKRGRQVFTAALYATTYTLPAQNTSLVYISKLDSSALGPRLPLTACLTRAFLTYQLGPRTRPSPTVKVCLFARSQGQYLFPNSKDRKKLGGLRLCGWWKALLESVVLELAAKPESSAPAASATGEDKIDMTYLLPSYASDEAAGMLGLPKHTLPQGILWRYAPPFVAPLVGGSGSASLATVVPAFDDDPKERFLVELVEADPFLGSGSASRLKAEKAVSSASATGADPAKEAQDAAGAAPAGKKRKRRGGPDPADEEAERKHTHGVLSRTTVEEYWERMGFRQECASGDVTGFFTLTVSPSDPKAQPDTDESGQPAASAPASHPPAPESQPSKTPQATDPPRASFQINHDVLTRLLEALLNTDFGSAPTAADGTDLWVRSAKTILESEIKDQGWKAVVGELDAKVDHAATTSSGPAGSNGEVPKRKKEEVVTMLQPRKKKRA